MRTVPITFDQAKQFIKVHHRHNKPPVGAKICIGMQAENHVTLTGVLVMGRPTARAYDDGITMEITRSCVIDCKNANSFLYGTSRKVATLLGYKRLITYTRKDESGSSLKAAGFQLVAVRPARKNWANSSIKLKSKRDATVEENVERCLWEVML